MSTIDSTSTLSAADYRALAEVRYRIRHFLHFSEEAARVEGLEAQQHQILLLVRAWNESGGHIAGPTIGQIADSMFIRHHSAVGLVDRLERRKMVERVRRRDDRREVSVRLTWKGAETLERLAGAHRAELRNSGPLLVEALAVVLRTRTG